ncbi:MAG TPA: hypothetical protein VFU22_19795, partial [Roseiflexaceae bacterium]|nr:hypothetical protein [Roseiflexaceae bacterium]
MASSSILRTNGVARRKAGAGGTLGVRALALTYLTVMLIIPLTVIFYDGLRDGLGAMWRSIAQPAAWH